MQPAVITILVEIIYGLLNVVRISLEQYLVYGYSADSNHWTTGLALNQVIGNVSGCW